MLLQKALGFHFKQKFLALVLAKYFIIIAEHKEAGTVLVLSKCGLADHVLEEFFGSVDRIKVFFFLNTYFLDWFLLVARCVC